MTVQSIYQLPRDYQNTAQNPVREEAPPVARSTGGRLASCIRRVFCCCIPHARSSAIEADRIVHLEETGSPHRELAAVRISQPARVAPRDPKLDSPTHPSFVATSVHRASDSDIEATLAFQPEEKPSPPTLDTKHLTIEERPERRSRASTKSEIEEISIATPLQSAYATASLNRKEKRTIKVLVVDDANPNRFMVQIHLKKMGHQCEMAEDGYVALDKIRASQEYPYDAVIMDHEMPGMTGLETSQAIRSLIGRDVVIISWSTVPEAAYRENVHDGSMPKGGFLIAEGIRQSLGAHFPAATFTSEPRADRK